MDDEPEFIAVKPSWEGPPPPSRQAPAPHPGRRRPSASLPWLLSALAAAAMAWLSFFVIVPLRHEVLVCQEQLRVAMATVMEGDGAPTPAAAATSQSGLPTERQQGDDTLFVALSQALAPFVDAGAVSAHPDEATVRLVVPTPRSGTQDDRALPKILQAVAQTLSPEQNTWRLDVIVSRHGPSERRVQGGRGTDSGRGRRQARTVDRLLMELDEALTPQHILWGLSLGEQPPGEVHLVLRPEAPAG